jgi:hypothetical protein
VSKIGTFRVLCVICSTFPFTHFSPTKPIPHFTIQNILPTKSATFNTPLISGIILGILGAGGKTGKSIFTLGINDGGSGNVGGSGMTGIVGIESPTKKLISKLYKISQLTSTLGGSGKLGNCGNGILVGTKLTFGSTIFIPNSI